MKDDYFLVAAITITITILSWVVVGATCFTIGYNSMQQNAVDSNVARWTVDDKAHVNFEWIKK
jgi:hypothetical protein